MLRGEAIAEELVKREEQEKNISCPESTERATVSESACLTAKGSHDGRGESAGC